MKRLFDKFKNLISKKKSEDEFDTESRSIAITNYGTNKTAFNEVVNMFCKEIEKQLYIKINPNDFIYEPQFKQDEFHLSMIGGRIRKRQEPPSIDICRNFVHATGLLTSGS